MGSWKYYEPWCCACHAYYRRWPSLAHSLLGVRYGPSIGKAGVFVCHRCLCLSCNSTAVSHNDVGSGTLHGVIHQRAEHGPCSSPWAELHLWAGLCHCTWAGQANDKKSGHVLCLVFTAISVFSLLGAISLGSQFQERYAFVVMSCLLMLTWKIVNCVSLFAVAVRKVTAGIPRGPWWQAFLWTTLMPALFFLLPSFFPPLYQLFFSWLQEFIRRT